MNEISTLNTRKVAIVFPFPSLEIKLEKENHILQN